MATSKAENAAADAAEALDASVARCRGAVDEAIAALPHRVTPTYEDIAVAIEAGVRAVLTELTAKSG